MRKGYLHIIIATAIFAGCTKIIFHPEAGDYADSKISNFQEWMIESGSGNKIRVRKYPAKDSAKASLLYFYGNAKNLTYRFSDYYWVTDHNYDLVLFDYSGYGKSEGKVGIKNSRKDGLAVFDFIKEKLNTPKTFYLGTSFGGATLLSAYSRYNNRQKDDILILDSTFPSYRRLGSHYFTRTIIGWPLSFLPWLFLRPSNDPGYRMDKIQDAEILVTHCEADKTIPIKFGKQLFEKHRGKKNFWNLGDCAHSAGFNDKNEKNRERLIEFLDNR